MRILLDTHAFLWFALGDVALPAAVRTQVSDLGNEVFLSAVTFYEIENKRRRDRLPRELPADLQSVAQTAGLALLPITPSHARRAGALPEPHRDPWDRLLIAQALEEELTIATRDGVFAQYGVRILW